MSPTIEIDQDVLDYLKSEAEPFVDTPSSVLRRLLDLNGRPATTMRASAAASARPAHDRSDVATRRASKRQSGKNKTSGRTRAASGTLLPEDAYVVPLLRALEAAGGEAPYRQIVDAVGEQLKDKLMPADFEELNSGNIRWHSRLQFVRLRLIERGDMDREAPRGVWRISNSGREALKAGDQA